MNKTCSKGHVYPGVNASCPYCVVEAEDDRAEVAAEQAATDARAKREASADLSDMTDAQVAARMQDDHLCVGCMHLAVCKIGKETIDNFRDGFFVIVKECSHYYAAPENQDEG